MVAVGTSHSEAAKLLKMTSYGGLTVACINSPNNVTIAGDEDKIDSLIELLNANGVFNRKLKVDTAYHSHHMTLVADRYMEWIKNVAHARVNSGIKFFSTTTPESSKIIDFTPQYWITNMVSQVKFSEGLMFMAEDMMSTDTTERPSNLIIEIGPHSALQGPSKQVFSDIKEFQFCYTSVLVRNKPAIDSFLDGIKSLWENGLPLDGDKLMSIFYEASHNLQPNVVTNLPSYPWNHAKYWHEPRLSRDHRLRQFSYHDLLGLLDVVSGVAQPKWRSHIGITSLPWLADHVVDGFIIFPGSGYLCMAIEAIKQLTQMRQPGLHIKNFLLRDVTFSKSIVIHNEENMNVEVQISLNQAENQWQSFHVFSYNNTEQSWAENCSGFIAVEFNKSMDEVECGREARAAESILLNILEKGKTDCKREHDKNGVYELLLKSGNAFGPTFRAMENIRTGDFEAYCRVLIPDVAKKMPSSFQSPYVIHPTTLDALNQIAAVLFKKQCCNAPVMPTYMGTISISSSILNVPGSELEVIACMNYEGKSSASGKTFAFQKAPNGIVFPVVIAKDWKLRAIGEAVASNEAKPFRRKMAYRIDQQPDIDTLNKEDFIQRIRNARLFDVISKSAGRMGSGEMITLNEKAATIYSRDAVKIMKMKKLTPSSPHLLKYFRWLEHQGSPDVVSSILGFNEGVKDYENIILSESAKSGVQGSLLMRIGNHISDILVGNTDPLQLMLSDGMLHQFYAESAIVSNYYQMVDYCHLLAYKNYSLKILEIGAGTGGATQPLLNALDQDSLHISRYCYTDISSGFFDHAQEKFSKYKEKMDFRTLDISQDPTSQGFADQEKFDLIIASNVIHATPDLETSMKHTRKLLRPGGKLILIEVTRLNAMTNMIFGTLPGWWVSKDTREGASSPLLSVNEWSLVLKNTGFSGVDISCPDHEEETAITNMIISTAQDSEIASSILQSQLVIGDKTEGTNLLVSALTSEVYSTSIGPIFIDEMEKYPNPQDIIFLVLDTMESPLLLNPTSENFKSIQNLMCKRKNILWVSFQEDSSADSAAIQNIITGFARVARKENQDMKLVILKIAGPISTISIENVTRAVQHIIKVSFTEENILQNWKPLETEYEFSNGTLSLPRVRPDLKFNDWIELDNGIVEKTKQYPYLNSSRPLKLEVQTLGLLNTLRFVDDTRPLSSLPADEIEIEARAYGINFKDVFVALGQMPSSISMVGEVAGVVTAVGENMNHLYKIGDRVAGMQAEPFSSRARLNGLKAHPLPQGISFVEGAALVTVFYTAWYCLEVTAQLKKGQTILIHAGSGGVGQAAIQIAQHIGAGKIFITVSSSEKKSFIKKTYAIPEEHIFSTRNTTFKDGILRLTGGKGVDLVLNSTSGENLTASWECVATFGMFVEIGKSDIYRRQNLSMVPFDRCVTFAAVDLSLLAKEHPGVIYDGLDQIMPMFEKGILKSVAPLTEFPMGNIEEAFRLIAGRKHIGKLVLVANENTMVKATISKPKSLVLNGDSNIGYVVVGGLGDLGKRIACFLAQKGATNIITLGRSMPTEDVLRDFEQKLAQYGARLHPLICDITESSSVEEAVTYCRNKGLKIKGIIHSGMVLCDRPLELMTSSEFKVATQPKVQGTLNLDAFFASSDLEFFILLSSVAGILGMTTQSNYAAGNTFQDAFAHAKNNENSHTRYITLDLGAIEGSNAILRLPIKGEELKRQGTIFMTFEELFKVHEYAISNYAKQDDCKQCILGFDWDSIKGIANFVTINNPLLSLLPRVEVHDGAKNAKSQNLNEETGRKLKVAKTTEEAEIIVSKMIADKFAIFLDEEVRTDVPISQLAMDSLVSIELKNWITRAFEAQLQASELAGALSIKALAKLVVSRSKLVALDSDGRDKSIKNIENFSIQNEKEKITSDLIPAHTFSCCKHTKELPKYPLVDLEVAMAYFVENTSHLLSQNKRILLQKSVDEILQPDGHGRKTYQLLVNRKNDKNLDSWMYDLITDAVYLKRPHPVAPYSNVMGTHYDPPIAHSQAERAAVVTQAAVQFQRMVQANIVEPYWYFGKSSCTWQLQWLFNSTRIPGVNGDKMANFESQNYIVVLRRGRVFKVKILDSEEQDLQYEDLKAIFESIISFVESDPGSENKWTGILTTDVRHSWAILRNKFAKISARNINYLKVIDEAMFLVCLDDGSPKTDEEHVRQSYFGDGFNRWMDKCIQYCITENGKSSFILEHGAIDGMTASRSSEWIHEAIQRHVAELEHTENYKTRGDGSTKIKSSQFQEFICDTIPEIDDHISLLRNRYISATSRLEYKHHVISALGTDLLMAAKVPVKSALDATIQLANRLFYGRNVQCWEGVSMAHYHKGRPEILQTCIAEAKRFCDVMLDEGTHIVNDSICANNTLSGSDKKKLLLKLGRKMSKNMQAALTGQTHLRLLDLLNILWTGRQQQNEALLWQRQDLFWENPFVMMHHAPKGSAVKDSAYGLMEPRSIWGMITPSAESTTVCITGPADKETERYSKCLDEAAQMVRNVVLSDD